MEIILTVFAFIMQISLYIYLVLFMAKLFYTEKYTKKQILITIGISILNIFICSLLKKVIPLVNLLAGLIFIFFNFFFILKNNVPKSMILSLLTFVIVTLTELVSYYLVSTLFNTPNNVYDFSFYYSFTIIILQFVFTIVLCILLKKLLKKYSSMYKMIEKITTKQLVTFLIVIGICILPQLMLFVFNKYNYPLYFFIINSIQIIVICAIIFFFTKTYIEKNKAESDLITTKMHNDTMTGMIDGIKILKHDYNNIIQALNGYVATKQYDKLQEHINKVLKECNVVNNLAVIDPEIFNEPAIYGIVGAKYFLITEKDITMDLDIMTNIKEINFPMPELSRILGILLDNAKEATLNAPNPYVRLEMRFDKRKCADIIRVINTYDTNISINLNEIYKKGVSSKKVKSGIGLWEVKKIVSKIPHAQIFPDIEKDKFVQTLIIEKIFN